MNEYEVRVTRLALEQMKEIVHYISNDLMAQDAADNLLSSCKVDYVLHLAPLNHLKYNVLSLLSALMPALLPLLHIRSCTISSTLID